MPNIFYPAYTGGELHPEAEAILSRIAAGDVQPPTRHAPRRGERGLPLPVRLGKRNGEAAGTLALSARSMCG